MDTISTASPPPVNTHPDIDTQERMSKETYYSVKRDLLVSIHMNTQPDIDTQERMQKRPTIVSKETY